MDLIIGLVGIALMLFLLLLGVPVSFAMGFSGLAGFAFLWGTGKAVSLTIITAYGKTDSFILACIPLFIFMGQTAVHCGLTSDLYTALYRWLARLPGGLAMATTAGSAGFAAVCGSSPATAATMGAMSLPEMRKFKYSPKMAAGCVAAAGTLGILIPPSIPMVIYGIMTEQSIGRLFIAGIIPGIISAFLYMMMIYLRARHNPTLAPPGPSFSWKERLGSIWKVWGVAFLFLVVVGGIYFGWFTPTEAAGVGAFMALVIGFVQNRLTQIKFYDSVAEATRITAMILAIIIGAMVFATFIVTSGLPMATTAFVSSLPVNRWVILCVMLIIYLGLGCVMDVIGIIVLTVPLFFPVILALGFDPIWFGIILTKMIEVSLITPPVGINCLIIKGVAGDYATLSDIFRGIGWFFATDLTTIALLLVFPQITLFLPALMYQ